jgi:hypothetical protein
VCGAVRYEFKGNPLTMLNCHCKTCQKVTGGPYVPVVIVLTKAFKLTKGALKYHYTEKVDEAGQHKRGFCADCGSRLTGAESDTPGRWLGLTASSLDDPSWFNAQFDIFVSHAQPWDVMDPKRPKHAKYPPK